MHPGQHRRCLPCLIIPFAHTDISVQLPLPQVLLTAHGLRCSNTCASSSSKTAFCNLSFSDSSFVFIAPPSVFWPLPSACLFTVFLSILTLYRSPLFIFISLCSLLFFNPFYSSLCLGLRAFPRSPVSRFQSSASINS